jgi:hypothetical protein
MKHFAAAANVSNVISDKGSRYLTTGSTDKVNVVAKRTVWFKNKNKRYLLMVGPNATRMPRMTGDKSTT